MLAGLVSSDAPCVILGMVIFSAALRKGSLNLFGAGLSLGRLIPPLPINACIAWTAGLGLVRFSASVAVSCCRSLLFVSARAAAPVSATGDRPCEWVCFDLVG